MAFGTRVLCHNMMCCRSTARKHWQLPVSSCRRLTSQTWQQLVRHSMWASHITGVCTAAQLTYRPVSGTQAACMQQRARRFICGYF